MDGAQRKLTHALVASGLSIHAYAQTTTIIALDDVLNEIEGRRLDAVRDSGRYFISIFGAPGGTAIRGAGDSRATTSRCTSPIADDELVSPTPIFLGSNPAEVRHNDRAIIRPCGEEEDLARDLLASLDAEQKRIAIICGEAPPDIVLMNLPRVPDVRAFEIVPELAALQARRPRATRIARRWPIAPPTRPRPPSTPSASSAPPRAASPHR